MLLGQAQKALEGLEALEEYLRTPTEEQARRMRQLEKEGDELRRILIDDLNRTFVTPIDREDIYALSRDIDDVLDYAYTTVDEMTILCVKPNDFLRRMASLLREAGQEIVLAVEYLMKRPSLAVEHATRAKTFENRVEAVYREAIAALFSGPQDVEHIVEMLKLREIYRHLSNAADRGDEAANVISDIVVKMT
jgi:predicted phosphate transport protein (TIGR00153 family)